MRDKGNAALIFLLFISWCSCTSTSAPGRILGIDTEHARLIRNVANQADVLVSRLAVFVDSAAVFADSVPVYYDSTITAAVRFDVAAYEVRKRELDFLTSGYYSIRRGSSSNRNDVAEAAGSNDAHNAYIVARHCVFAALEAYGAAYDARNNRLRTRAYNFARKAAEKPPRRFEEPPTS